MSADGTLLTVDVSNAQTSLVAWHGDEAAHYWSVATESRRTVDELSLLFASLVARDRVALGPGSQSILACVVPGAAQATRAALLRLIGSPALEVGPGMRTGLRIRTEDPREVGPDRIANAVAARAARQGSAIVLDFATALTIDIIGPEGDYLGAIIAPGLEAAAAELAGSTARLSGTRLLPPETAIAGDTFTALQSGCVLGYVGLVEGLLALARRTVPEATVYATGEADWLPALLDEIPGVDVVAPLLTHNGLRLLCERQQRGLERSGADGR